MMTALPEFVVRCRAMRKTYGKGSAEVAALRGVDLDVRYGELLILAGPSGCGKTSLISIIAAILEPDSGSCYVLGQDVQGLRPVERARFRCASIGFVFQTFNLLPALTAVENVSVPLLINGSRRRQAEARAGELLDMVGLADRRQARPSALSGGQQQRVAIARALACDPSVIVCDEPTSSLDHESGQGVMILLRHHARRSDRAVIVVTHDPRVFEFADRVARMDDGRIVEITHGGSP